ncbi:hypothetical protein ADICYQ_3713 [Cyclobacterium qasimii M12-11B]|uniref:Uncharacterized protein n=1 Tax=Cyclobacterium qasimii M12-11B TaxID=641524 RepID=S7WSS2_9BACT|nr:hypothetical protein ADICYQ_3713 [Cyclobacterium qasimii M12-11B]
MEVIKKAINGSTLIQTIKATRSIILVATITKVIVVFKRNQKLQHILLNAYFTIKNFYN